MVEPLRGVRDGYLIPLNLGTPPQPVQLYMDTGSDLTWAPCGNLTFSCIDCDEAGITPKTFSPSLSSTCYRDPCGSRFCSDVHSSDNSLDPCTISGCSLPTLLTSVCPRPCPSFAYTYGGGGAVTGTLTRDTLHVSGGGVVPRFCFGCVGSTYREPIGIAGFGRGPLSLPSQLGFGRTGFSHCFLPFKYANNSTSLLLVGEASLSYREGMHFTPMLTSPLYPNYYYVGLEALTVVGTTTTAETPTSLREFDSQGNGGMLMDSGTTYTHLPEPYYSDLLSTLRSAIVYPRAADVETKTGFDLCYRVPSVAVGFPVVTFRFLNNVSVVLGEESLFYAMAAASNGTVVKCMLMQSMEEEGEEGPAGVFGSFQQQNLEVVYDLGNQRIGFRGMDCASAAAPRPRGLGGRK
ncbi:unnamed protein product [Linum tenue]|uniref:Peptidase A1 domain-containing protein n=2 Tax=Linum tenue TaxID=586396 RepID=A0AAV0Q5K3_9ROSI|nr:unnamed protein product [Linum tenue]